MIRVLKCYIWKPESWPAIEPFPGPVAKFPFLNIPCAVQGWTHSRGYKYLPDVTSWCTVVMPALPAQCWCVCMCVSYRQTCYNLISTFARISDSSFLSSCLLLLYLSHCSWCWVSWGRSKPVGSQVGSYIVFRGPRGMWGHYLSLGETRFDKSLPSTGMLCMEREAVQFTSCERKLISFHLLFGIIVPEKGNY